TAAYYPPGTPATTCVDDAGEDDDTVNTPRTLVAGTHPGRRLCGADADVVRVDVPAGATLTASLSWAPSQGGLTAELLTSAFASLELATDADGDGRVTLRREAVEGGA